MPDRRADPNFAPDPAGDCSRRRLDQPAGRRASSTPMLEPGWLAVATPLVAPAVGWDTRDDDMRTSRVLVELGEAASQASAHPAGAVIVPSALTVARCTSMVPSVVVVIDGAGTAVLEEFTDPFTALSGWDGSTPL